MAPNVVTPKDMEAKVMAPKDMAAFLMANITAIMAIFVLDNYS